MSVLRKFRRTDKVTFLRVDLREERAHRAGERGRCGGAPPLEGSDETVRARPQGKAFPSSLQTRPA